VVRKIYLGYLATTFIIFFTFVSANQKFMVYIYSPSGNTKRLNYILRHIFKEILCTDFTVVQEKSLFLQQSGACINYSGEDMRHGLHIVPQGLLVEKGIRTISDLKESEWMGFFCFFKQEKGDIPFDIFAASFYLLTLYEEYLSDKVDEHGRYPFRESLAYRKGFLEIPLIDRWTYLLKEMLEKTHPDFTSQKRAYRFISTFDIDHPYLYLKKGWIKSAGGTIRDLLKSDFKSVATRFAVLLHLKPDPYMEAIQWIDEIQKEAKLPYLIFILTGGKGKYGKSAVYPTHAYHQRLKRLEGATAGLHPSYNTYLNIKQLIKEKKDLEKILGKVITANRQHFLRLHIPETFQELGIAGLNEDFSLAFAQAPGFRSGTAIPHPFYDVEKESETDLQLHPTIVMDSTLISHLGLNTEEALAKMKKLADECKQSGGDYVSLWHNSNLAGENNPWKKVFIDSIHYAISLENDNFVPA
jgi:hypothetical protein